jgi:hypothetical protein
MPLIHKLYAGTTLTNSILKIKLLNNDVALG